MLAFVFSYIFFLYKYVLHLITGRTELGDVLTGKHTEMMNRKVASLITTNKEYSGLCGKSRDKNTNEVVHHLSLDFDNLRDENKVTDVLNDGKLTTQQLSNLRLSIQQLINVNFSINTLSKLRQETFSYENVQHVKLLDEQWRLLKPDVHRGERVTEKWQEVGYQGKDPTTDFRGMGVLALKNLVHFADNETKTARDILEESHDVDHWYPFSVAGINFTSEIFNLLVTSESEVLELFSGIYTKVFKQFHEQWKEEGCTVMQFNEKKNSFFSLFK
ncbi:ELMO domain-containing protein [Acrasis kona]|uniref:ELMO domain-containing protein n=1 Tax=Acrasis kona TaxID=1008807 RepID=A0AAW2YXR4_9EUKA